MAKTKRTPRPAPTHNGDANGPIYYSERATEVGRRAAYVGLPPFVVDDRPPRGGVVRKLSRRERQVQAEKLRRALYLLADFALVRRMRSPQLRAEVAYAAYEGIVNHMHEKHIEYLLDCKEQLGNKPE